MSSTLETKRNHFSFTTQHLKKNVATNLKYELLSKPFVQQKKGWAEKLGSCPWIERACLSKSSVRAAGEFLPVHWKSKNAEGHKGDAF